MTTKNSVRTIYGALVQSAGRWGGALRLLPNSTLNQKFNVRADDRLYENERSTVKYLVVGLKGIAVELQANGLYLVKPRNYLPSQAALFSHTPLCMRRITEPLTPDERRNLRIRTTQEFNGVMYECWWARVLEDDGNPAIAEKRTVVNGSVVPVPWEPTLEDLNPSTNTLNPNQGIVNGNVHLASSKMIVVNFTPQDIQEIIAAVTIIHGDPGFAELSEFALVSGVDRQVPGDFNGIQQNYTEAIYAQINDFLRTRVSAPDSLGGKTITIDSGMVEPMLLGTNI